VLALPVWLGLGIEELSLSAQAILPVKESMLRTTAEESRPLLERLMRGRTAVEIREMVENFHAETAGRTGRVHPGV
jgi:phosphotransferase system enzyme I (PtsI)